MTQTLVRQLAIAAAFALAASPALAQGRSSGSPGNSEFGLGRAAERVPDHVQVGGRNAGKAKKGSNKCWDVDRNGYCDDLQRRSPRCDDRNRDGRCDDVYGPARGYPATLPDMAGAILVSRGRTSSDVTRWLGERALTVRTDATRGRVRRASWYDRSGQLLQTWTDRDLDGRADVVQVYRSGQIVRTITG